MCFPKILFSAKCDLCRITFSIKNQRISEVKQHARGNGLLQNEKEMRNQGTFIPKDKKFANQTKLLLSKEQSVLKKKFAISQYH